MQTAPLDPTTGRAAQEGPPPEGVNPFAVAIPDFAAEVLLCAANMISGDIETHTLRKWVRKRHDERFACTPPGEAAKGRGDEGDRGAQ